MSHDTAELARRLEELKQERDYLLVHSQNLELELRRAVDKSVRIRELEDSLAAAQARLEQQETTLRMAEHLYWSVINSGTWRVLEPYRALRRLLQRFRS